MRILVGDDQRGVLDAVQLLLKSEGHSSVAVDNPAAVLHAAADEPFDVILIDLNYARDTTSGREGLDLVTELHSRRVRTPVVVMTAWGSIDLAVEAMQRGATDFVQKPWDNSRLLDVIHKQGERGRSARTEIEIARKVQKRLFPRDTVDFDTLEYAAHCSPAGDIGGDYYDVFEFGDRRLGFVLADVSGKGIGAALLMANLQGAFRSHLSKGCESLPALVQDVNRQFFASTPAEQYATMICASYDDSTGHFCYVNAGHPAGLLRRRNGTVEYLGSTSTVVGLFREWSSREVSLQLSSGDLVLLYSDGVAESPESLATVDENEPVASIVQRLTSESDGSDDATVLGLRVR